MAERMEGARQRKLRSLLKDLGVDALVVRDLTNIRYLSGFKGSYGLLVVDAQAATLITDGRYAELAGEMVSSTKVKLQPMTGVEDFLVDHFKKCGYRKIGYETTQTLEEFENLKKLVKPSKAKLVAASGLVKRLRATKDAGEIRVMSKAAVIADRMMEAAYRAIRSGVPESEVAKMVRRAAEDAGASGTSFETIVASGPNASRPHHRAGARKLRANDMVTLDLGAIVDGYCSDLTRNPYVGKKVSAKFEKMYNTCLAANEAGLAAVRAGVNAKDVDAASREVIESAGYGKYFTHGTGHGVGLDIHEMPRLAKTSTDVLEEGFVVTVEPGIYVPGFGGVRIEDLVVVTKGKPKILSHTPKELTLLKP